MAGNQYSHSPDMVHGGETTEKAQPQARASRQKLFKILAIAFGAAAAVALIISLSLHFALKPRPSPLPLSSLSPSITKTVSVHGPVIDSNFADPAFIEVNGTFYAFATNKYIKPQIGQVNIQIATSTDFATWNLTGIDALPNTGNWTTQSYTWAPDVVQVPDGFVMYYSGKHANATGHHCIGAATSANIMGPYEPLPEPVACPLPAGAIDPYGFKDFDGRQYLLYKVDGNSLDSRTSPSNPTPIMLQEVDPNDGITFVGTPLEILNKGIEDGPLIEAPSLARIVDQATNLPVYVLFYSSNLFTTKYYDVKYATSTTGITGPYTKPEQPLLATGSNDGKLFAPGGLSIGLDGHRVVFHAGADPNPANGFVRNMWTGYVNVNNTVVSI